ncbi:MAG: zinc ribbon domain-containing protein, partial [Desulfuromonadales bacterium]|nr:zinc ribbon domain-containing protein [Desulfuromonadales bacterium]
MYEYQCKECGLVFEARQKFSDPPLTECRECNGEVAK